MQTVYSWYKLPLYRYKIVLLVVLVTVGYGALAQSAERKNKRKKTPRYERKVSYGFVVGGHVSAYQVRYANRFVTPDFDTVHSVMAPFSPGFSLGFLVNLKLTSFLDLRVLPKAGFYQYKLEYNYTGAPAVTRLVETTMVELPLQLKYKSIRRGGVSMYVVGGLTPSFEASGQNEEQPTDKTVSIKRWDLTLDAGIGLDIYLRFFKLSPEIRFSGGVLDLLGAGTSAFNAPLRRINTNIIAFYLIFQ